MLAGMAADRHLFRKKVGNMREDCCRRMGYGSFCCVQLVSMSGTWMHAVTQGWLIYSLTSSPLWLGIVAALSALPVLLGSFWGGTLSDRYSHRKILLFTQSGLAFSSFLLGFIVESGMVEIWHIAASAFLFGVINAIDAPARQSFLACLAGSEQLTRALACHSAMLNSSRILGPLLAGFCMTRFGSASCFYLNAVSFLPTLVFLLRQVHASTVLPHYELPATAVEVLSFLKRERFCSEIVCGVALFSFLGISCFTLMPVIAAECLQSGPFGLSILTAASGIGAFIAALMAAWKASDLQNIRFLPSVGVVFSLCIFGLSCSSAYFFSLVLAGSAGGAVTIFLAMSNRHILCGVPESMRGRMVSLSVCAVTGLAPFGSLAIGMLADAVGSNQALRFFSAILMVGCCFMFCHYELGVTNGNSRKAWESKMRWRSFLCGFLSIKAPFPRTAVQLLSGTSDKEKKRVA